MSTERSPDDETVSSEVSLDKTSTQSQWSVSSCKSTTKDTELPVVNVDSNNSKAKPRGFYSLLYLLQSLFRRDKGLRDIESLISKLKHQIELILEFLEGSLASRFKLYGEQISFPKLQRGSMITLQGVNQFSLPATQLWVASNLLRLYWETKRANGEKEICENTIPDLINLPSLRRFFLSLFWEMQILRQVAQVHHTKHRKFTNEMSSTLKRLRKVVLSGKMSKSLGAISISSVKNRQDAKPKRGTFPRVLEMKPNLRPSFPFRLAIDLERNDRDVATLNQDFSQLAQPIQEEIICGLLTSVVESLQHCQILFESSAQRLDCGGVILKGSNGTKDITCRSALRDIRSIVKKMQSVKSSKLKESEAQWVLQCISAILETWNKYMTYSEWVTLRAYELCDMVMVCYLLAFKDMNMNIPDMERVQKEVDRKSKFPKNDKPILTESNLKHYAIGGLIEECNEKSRAHFPLTKTFPYNLWPDALNCTKYHSSIQECPLELINSSGKYVIRLRTLPDFERVDENMVLLDCGDYTSVKY